MTSIRKTKKALKRKIRWLESQTDYSCLGVNDYLLQRCASEWSKAWIVAFKESELESLIVRYRVKSFHTKMMRKFKVMPESPKKEELRYKLIETRNKYGEPNQTYRPRLRAHQVDNH